MDDMKKRLIHLHHCRGVGWKTIYQMFKNDPSLTSFWNVDTIPYLPPSSQKNLLEDLHSKTIKEQIKNYHSSKIQAITIFDKEYPPLLKETYEPPWVLYGKGNPQLLEDGLKLAVVGSREISNYGKNAIEAIFPKLIEKGFNIVSGLASGVDTMAHRTAMKLGGKTIAVIAGGLYHVYPKQNKDLSLEMMSSQLVISEYPPHTPPSKWHFPMRNRIISGISRGTLIIEAKERSGSLITANYAVQEGREVFALPGNVFSPNSQGTNELIQQGAKLVRNADDIIAEFLY